MKDAVTSSFLLISGVGEKSNDLNHRECVASEC